MRSPRLSLGAQVVGRRECEGLTVPERCVVAGVVIVVADRHGEHDPLEQAAPHLGVRALAVEQIEDARIGGMAGRHLVEAEHREPADHQPSAGADPVEPFDDQDITAKRRGEP